MTHVLTVLVTSAGTIIGYELTKRWFEKRKTPITSASDRWNSDGWEMAQRRAVRLVKLQRLVGDALPADPDLDSPYQRELREAAFGE